MTAQKQLARNLYRSRLSTIDPEDRIRRSKRLRESLHEMIDTYLSRESRLFVFAPTMIEPDILGEEDVWSSVRLCFPKVLPDGLMSFYEVQSIDDLAVGRFSIREPNALVISKDKCIPGSSDVMLVPGLAFTEGGHRLGQGRGYYDRFLSSLSDRPYLIGVQFKETLAPTPWWGQESHDHLVDLVMSC